MSVLVSGQFWTRGLFVVSRTLGVSMTIEDSPATAPGLPVESAFERQLDQQQEATDRDYERRWWTLGSCASASS
jgi:hypothetical protein